MNMLCAPCGAIQVETQDWDNPIPTYPAKCWCCGVSPVPLVREEEEGE